MHIERVGNIHCKLGEGPVWDVREQALYFTDVIADTIWRYEPGPARLQSWKTPGLVGSLALREQGGAVVALGHGFHTFDFVTGTASLISDPRVPGSDTQFNDGKADRRGRFFAGTVHKRMSQPAAALYRVDVDLEVTQIDSGFIVTNGPCWNPEGNVFYFADSTRQVIYAYDYDLDSGNVTNRRVFADTSALGGIPDGATVDRDGRLWSALCNAGKIACYRPEATLESIIEMPVKLVSSVMFGGPNLDQLYCTSIDPAAMPPEFGCDVNAGGGELFVITGLGAIGVPEPRFAG